MAEDSVFVPAVTGLRDKVHSPWLEGGCLSCLSQPPDWSPDLPGAWSPRPVRSWGALGLTPPRQDPCAVEPAVATGREGLCQEELLDLLLSPRTKPWRHVKVWTQLPPTTSSP